MLSISSDYSSRVAAANPVQDSTDLSVDQYSLEILGLLGYYDVLEKMGSSTQDPAWVQEQLQNCLTQINAAIGAGSSKLDPQVWQVLQQFQTNGAGYSDSWWSGITANMPGGGSISNWIAAHSDASWQGSDSTTMANMNFSAMMLQYDLYTRGQTTDFWTFQDNSRIHPFLPSPVEAGAAALINYFYVEAGSPQPGTAGWSKLQESINAFANLTGANPPPYGSPQSQFFIAFDSQGSYIGSGSLPPQMQSDSYSFSVIFSDYLAYIG